jgi:hypothetical protein
MFIYPKVTILSGALGRNPLLTNWDCLAAILKGARVGIEEAQ